MKKKQITIVSLILALIFNLIMPVLPNFQARQVVYAASSGPRYPTSATTQAVNPEDDANWSNPSYIGADDSSDATCSLAAKKYSYRLKAQAFGFSIPPGTIKGIVVEINHKATDYSIEDIRVQLLDASGNLVGDNKYIDGFWDKPFYTLVSYGGTTDTWNASPTPSMINDADFGVVLSVQNWAAVGTYVAYVDFIRITVYYNSAPSAPTSLLTEGAINPTGVADTTPEFSAVYNDPDSGDTANKYQIQVDDDSGFGSTIWDSGASGTSMTNCAQGNRCQDISYAGSALSWGTKYYWRIKYWDDDGAEGAWSTESAYFTMNKVSNTPSLDSPSNGATGQSLTPALKTTATDDNSDYLRYKIELCTDQAMTQNCQTFDQTSSQTGWSGQNTQGGTAYTSGTQATYTIQSALTNDQTYYWRSYAIDPGGTNTWSSTQGTPYSFTTTQAPTAPTSLETEGSTNPTGVTDTTPEFSAVYNDPDTNDVGKKYRIQVDDDPAFGSTIWDSGASGTSMTDCTQGTRCQEISYAGGSLSWGTQYYWRIKYWDDKGAEGAWSTESAHFTMNYVSNTPSLDSPADTATNQSVTPALKTTATDDDSDYLRYKIELDKVNTFDSGDLQTFDQTASQTGWSGQNAESGTAYASGTQATYTIQSALDANTTYYWRSYAIDPAGTNTWSSTQSPVYSFTTTQNPIAPSDLEAEEATNPTNVTDTTPEFTAIYNDPDTGDTAVYYQIQVNTQSNFGGTSMWDSTKTSMSPLTEGQRSSAVSYDGSALQWGETYYWRIKFWDNGGTASPWSTETAYFTMGAIAAPTGCLIDDGGQPDQLIVKWQDNTGLETGYRIERNTDSGGFAYLADEAADSTSHTDSTTSADHTYQYRVRAESASGNSGWCTTMTVNLAEGSFKFSGVRLEGLMIE